MKKAIALVLTCLLLLPCFAVSAFTDAAPIEVAVDGVMLHFDAAPFIENDRTLVPVRALCVALGIADENIIYQEGTVAITGTANGKNAMISLTIGSNIAAVNGETITLDVPAKIVGEHTYIPLRFVSETFGCQVQFYGTSPAHPNRNLIEIKTPAYGAFSILASQSAIDEGIGELFKAAAAITYTTNIRGMINGQDAIVERTYIMLAAGEAVVIVDDGFLTDDQMHSLASMGAFAVLDDAIAKYAPSALEWINSNAEVKQSVTDSEGNLIAFPVERNGKVERLFVSATTHADRAVSLIHGYRELVKSLAEAGMDTPTAEPVRADFTFRGAEWGASLEEAQAADSAIAGETIERDATAITVINKDMSFMNFPVTAVWYFDIMKDSKSPGLYKIVLSFTEENEQELLAAMQRIYGEISDTFLDEKGIENPLSPAGWVSYERLGTSLTEDELSILKSWYPDMEKSRMDTILRQPLVQISFDGEQNLLTFSASSATVLKYLQAQKK